MAQLKIFCDSEAFCRALPKIKLLTVDVNKKLSGQGAKRVARLTLSVLLGKSYTRMFPFSSIISAGMTKCP
jgi:hypothetical protein